MRLPSGERISTDRSGSGDPGSAWWRKRWDSTHGLKNSPPDCFSPACGRVALFSSPPLKPPLKNAPTCGWCIPYWRKRWDSNPRALAGYLISSFSRIDRCRKKRVKRVRFVPCFLGCVKRFLEGQSLKNRMSTRRIADPVFKAKTHAFWEKCKIRRKITGRRKGPDP